MIFPLACRSFFRQFQLEQNQPHTRLFLFDATPVMGEYTEVSRIVSEYKPALENGAVDPDIILPEFISKLKAAGIDKIVDEKQKQLYKWVEDNK